MSEDYFTKQDADLYWFAGVVAVVLILHIVSYLRFSQKKRNIHMKKFALASLCVLTVYLALSIPYVGFFNNFSSKEEYPKEISSSEEVGKYIKDHHNRIENLERELEEARTEMRMLRDHYKNLFSLIVIFVLIYSGYQIFSSKKDKDLEETQPEQLSK